LFDKSQTTLLLCPGGKVGSFAIPSGVFNIADSSFIACEKLTAVSIPNGVTNVGNGAFSYCTGLTNVTIPNSISGIKDSTFFLCTSLTTVTIPNSITFIGSWVFAECSSLVSVTIPSSVTNFGDYTFYQSTSLRGIYFKGNAPGIGSHCFDSDNNAIVYYLPGTIGWSSTFGGLATAPWFLPNPLILVNSPRFGVEANRFGFIISWATNIPVAIEASTDLASPIWSPVRTNTLTGGSSYFSDPQWTNYPARFYRLRSP
jgi:hypothetical protein